MNKQTKNTIGRPKGSANKKSSVLRDEKLCWMRVSRGFNMVLHELIDKGIYTSKADAIHEAVEILAKRKLPHFIWTNKIQ